jgi:hypothetical protein
MTNLLYVTHVLKQHLPMDIVGYIHMILECYRLSKLQEIHVLVAKYRHWYGNCRIFGNGKVMELIFTGGELRTYQYSNYADALPYSIEGWPSTSSVWMSKVNAHHILTKIIEYGNLFIDKN